MYVYERMSTNIKWHSFISSGILLLSVQINSDSIIDSNVYTFLRVHLKNYNEAAKRDSSFFVSFFRCNRTFNDQNHEKNVFRLCPINIVRGATFSQDCSNWKNVNSYGIKILTNNFLLCYFHCNLELTFECRWLP